MAALLFITAPWMDSVRWETDALVCVRVCVKVALSSKQANERLVYPSDRTV